jgi:hypothetical protein
MYINRVDLKGTYKIADAVNVLTNESLPFSRIVIGHYFGGQRMSPSLFEISLYLTRGHKKDFLVDEWFHPHCKKGKGGLPGLKNQRPVMRMTGNNGYTGEIYDCCDKSVIQIFKDHVFTHYILIEERIYYRYRLVLIPRKNRIIIL